MQQNPSYLAHPTPHGQAPPRTLRVNQTSHRFHDQNSTAHAKPAGKAISAVFRISDETRIIPVLG
jgi:hypothetical protein